MYRDVSEIRQQGCNVINASNQITNYYGRSRIQYTLIGNKYKAYSQSTNNYDYDTSSYVCYTNSQIAEFQSDYDVYMPIYQSIALILALLLFWTIYVLFIRIWWRRI